MTQDLTSHLLRAYFTATNWDPTQSYLHLTSTSSSILLDFPIPAGLSLSISSCSSPSTFYSTHRLRALPHLAGSLGYVFARTERPLDLRGITGSGVGEEEGQQRDDRLRHVLERFRIVNEPRAPSSTLPGASSPRDYLLYGNIHAPTCRLDALYTTRLSPTWNLILTACSFPPRNPNHAYIPTENAAAGGQGRTAPGATNLQVTVQNEVGGGRWFNEWSYSVDDALWGFRTMHHFGHRGAPTSGGGEVDTTTEPATSSPSSSGSSSVGGGLRGRFSAGGELFFSAAEKSAGLSTGVRFTTLPEPASSSEDGAPPSQPPTTITATLNPMMGHMSTAYAAQVARDVVCCSRYDFNVYSYESELTVGGEYWLRGSSGGGKGAGAVVAQEEEVVGRGATTARSLVPAMAREASLRSGAGAGAGTSRPSSSSSGSGSSLPQSALGLPARELTSSTSTTRSHASLRDRDVDVEVEVEPPAPGTPTLPPPATPSEEQHPPLPAGTLPPAPAPQPPRLPPPIVVNEPPPAPRGLLKTSFNLSTLLLSLLYQGSLSNGCIVRVGLRVDLLRGAGAGARGFDGLKAGGKSGAGGGGGSGAAGILRGVGMEVVYLGGGGGGEGVKAKDAGEATLRQEGTMRLPPVVVVAGSQAGGQDQGGRIEM